MQRLQFAAEIPPEEPAVLTPLDGTNWNIMKGPLKSMYLWDTLKPNCYQRQVEKALDKFYTDASHLSVKIPDAVAICFVSPGLGCHSTIPALTRGVISK